MGRLTWIGLASYSQSTQAGVDGWGSLAHVRWELSVFPFTTLEDSSIHGEVALEDSVLRARCAGM